MTSLLTESYDALAAVVSRLRDDEAWASTGCVGWTVRDLVWHLHADAVRGLVAVPTPAGRAADCNEIAYWRSWGSGRVADLASTLAVEATLDHTDLVARIDASGPTASGLDDLVGLAIPVFS